jgi:hypothetical protein
MHFLNSKFIIFQIGVSAELLYQMGPGEWRDGVEATEVQVRTQYPMKLDRMGQAV